jgi:hypothetical protein
MRTHAAGSEHGNLVEGGETRQAVTSLFSRLLCLSSVFLTRSGRQGVVKRMARPGALCHNGSRPLTSAHGRLLSVLLAPRPANTRFSTRESRARLKQAFETKSEIRARCRHRVHHVRLPAASADWSFRDALRRGAWRLFTLTTLNRAPYHHRARRDYLLNIVEHFVGVRGPLLTKAQRQPCWPGSPSRSADLLRMHLRASRVRFDASFDARGVEATRQTSSAVGPARKIDLRELERPSRDLSEDVAVGSFDSMRSTTCVGF